MMPYDPENKNENKNRGKTMRDIALAYYDEFGWYPLPVWPNKVPKIEYRKRYGYTKPSREEIAGWPEWDTPKTNIATVTGAITDLVVVDADSETAIRYLRERGGISACPAVKTFQGEHLYFSHPGFHIGPKVKIGGIEDLDIRGDGGIAVIPPSKHASGAKYDWMVSPKQEALPPLPSWLIEVLEKDDGEKKRVNWHELYYKGLKKGARNDAIFKAGCSMRGSNFPFELALTNALTINQKFDPPLEEQEVWKALGSAWGYPAGSKEAFLIADEQIEGEEEEKPKAIRLQPISLADLLRKEFPPTRWAVKNLIPEGAMLFAAKPKLGKSLLMLDVCIAIASGRKALGHYPVERGKTLFLSLEDPEKRVWERAKARLEEEDPEVVAQCHLLFESGKLDTGLVTDLDEWLVDNPDTRLVVIDTLAKVKGKQSKNAQLYDADYAAVEGITQLSHKHNVAIILITHTNQSREIKDPMELIQGSSGLTGGVDGGMVLLMGRGEAEAYLHVAHKDITSHVEIAMTKDEGDSWLYLGEAEQYRMDSKRKKILALLSDEDSPLTPKEITESLPGEGWKVENVQRMLTRMHGEGIVKNEGRGLYVLGHNAPGITSLNAPVRYEKKEGGEEAF